MNYVVTGAAGFIGSHLVDRLLADDGNVVAIDSFSPSFHRSDKRDNRLTAMESGNLDLHDRDLAKDPIDDLFAPGDVVFHLAGQPGVRPSWHDFESYLANNLLATQRLLGACERRRVERVIYSSSSSVYGNASQFPTSEDASLAPRSPYGMTKKGAEDLVRIYADKGGFQALSLRYFTVYGPRQRSDMAVRRIIDAALNNTTFGLYGDGSQTRDLTFVADVVEANVAAGVASVGSYSAINVAGGAPSTVNELIDEIAKQCGTRPTVLRQPTADGDVAATCADTGKARALLGWMPKVGLEEGLHRQIVWQQQIGSALRQTSVMGT